MFRNITQINNGKTKRQSSWERSGRNADFWLWEPGQSRIIADIKGPGLITHIWMTQPHHYRDVLIKITWDNADKPSVLCPLGDFFGLGHTIVNSYQSLFFTASTRNNNKFEGGCALNCYLPMPFKERAVVELVNESDEVHRQYFYVDYEQYNSIDEMEENAGYLHAEFHRQNPFDGWGHEIRVNQPEANIINKEELAWKNNYVILETEGRGHYIGCNYSVTNFQGSWWGEGDDMIWVDGYKWPPDLHGTGSEDYFNQAWGMQDNAFLRNGSSIHEDNTGGYQTSYVFHLENPVRFNEEIKVTIEFGHGNHLRNEVSSVAYWYAEKPAPVKQPPSVEKRQPVKKKDGKWLHDEQKQITTHKVEVNDEMRLMKDRWRQKTSGIYIYGVGKLTENQEGQLCMKMRLSNENPNYYEIPFAEIGEDLDQIGLQVEIVEGRAIRDDGRINECDVAKLVKLPKPEVLLKGSVDIRKGKFHIHAGAAGVSDFWLKEKISDIIGHEAELEVLRVFDEDLLDEDIQYRLQIRHEST